MNYSKYIDILKKELNFYITHGGDIYAPRREHPLYDKLRYAASLFKSETTQTIPLERVYFDCGIKFDRNYERYNRLMNGLKQCTDRHGFVHFDENNTVDYLTENLLKHVSFEIGLTPSEYLILMTPFRSKTVMTTGDYIQHIVDGLHKTFPEGNVKNIKRTNNELYEEIRHFQKYSPVPLTFDEAIEFFGFNNTNSRKSASTTGNYLTDKKEILSSLKTLYPDRNVGHLIGDNKSLYYQIVTQARSNDQTIAQWLDSNGYEYPFAQNAKRLTRYKVDAQEHEAKLVGLQSELLKNYKTENTDDFDKFEIKWDIAKRISSIIHNDEQVKASEDTSFIVDALKVQPAQETQQDNQSTNNSQPDLDTVPDDENAQ